MLEATALPTAPQLLPLKKWLLSQIFCSMTQSVPTINFYSVIVLTLAPVVPFGIEAALGSRGAFPDPLLVQAPDLVDDVAGEVVHLLAGRGRLSLRVAETSNEVLFLD